MHRLDGARIRPLTEADWPLVHDLVVEVAAAGKTYALAVPGSEAETRAFWTGEHLAVAADGEVVLGTAKMGPNRPAQGSHVGTASFVVGSAVRGRGVGRALGEYAVQWHRDHGFAGIQFNAVVSTNTAAVALWRSLGFETVGTVPGAFRLPDDLDCTDGPPYADLLVMYLDLEGS